MVLFFYWQFPDAPPLGKVGDKTKNDKRPHQDDGKSNREFSSICVTEKRVA